MINIDIRGQMDAQGAKEVAQSTNEKVAEGKRFFIKCIGVSLVLVAAAFAVSLVKWW